MTNQQTPAEYIAALREAMREAKKELYEINPGNYDDNEVTRLNNASITCYHILDTVLAVPMPEMPTLTENVALKLRNEALEECLTTAIKHIRQDHDCDSSYDGCAICDETWFVFKTYEALTKSTDTTEADAVIALAAAYLEYKNAEKEHRLINEFSEAETYSRVHFRFSDAIDELQNVGESLTPELRSKLERMTNNA